MTTFGNQHRIGSSFLTPHTSYEAVCRTVDTYRRTVVDGNDLTQFTRLTNLLDLHEVRMMTEYMTNSDDHSLFTGCLTDSLTFFQCRCDRLLQKDMISCFNSEHTRLKVHVLRSTYHHSIRFLRLIEEILVVCKTLCFGQTELFGYIVTTDVI